MHTLHISLLGDFHLVYGTELLTSVNTPRLQALLAYLVIHRQAPQPRQHIAFQFWPDSSEKQAHTNLRKLLFQLRNALPEPDRFLMHDYRSIHWRPDAPYTLDVADLQATLARCITPDGKPLVHARQDDLAQVVNRYQGELLPGCFDEWILPIRHQLHGAAIQALERIISLSEHQREYQAGIRYAQRLIGLDPLHEAGYRRLMQLYALNGDRAAALHHYHTCVSILQQELGVVPGEETQALYEQLFHRHDQTVLTKAAIPSPAAPLIGRQVEWDLLLTAWQRAQRGSAEVVSIAGEAGIGKTRLTEELMTWASARGFCLAHTRSYEAEGGLAYAPVTEWLRASAIKAGLQKLDKVWLREVARLLPELLTERTDLNVPTPLTETWQRQRFFEAITRAILAEKRPLLLVIDDLQWCDQETLAWLRFLLRYDAQARLLVVGAWRSEAVNIDHPVQTLLRDLSSGNQLTTIKLAALTRQATAALAQHIAECKLTPTATEELYQSTEGHPLFVIETIRAMGNERVRAWGSERAFTHHPSAHPLIPLPTKVQTVLQFRLAQLSMQAHDLVGLAAIVGRRFTFAVLTHASDLAENALVQALDELWQRHIIREQGIDAYDFAHDKIREVAYQSLSQARRRLLHRRVAEALQQLYADDLDKVCGELAIHFERANLPDQALTFYQKAATVAFRQRALLEVNNFCQHGLRLLHTHAFLRTNIQRELKLLVMLTATAAGVQGYTVEDIKAYYERALTLSAETEPGEWTISIYYGLWAYYFSTAAFAEADGLAAKMPAQAVQLHDPFLLELAHHGRGLTMLYRGSPTAALTQLTQSLSFAQSRTNQGETFQQSQTLTLMTHSFKAMTLWLQGYPDQARAASQEALQLQKEQPTPLNQAAAFTLAAVVHGCLRDKAVALTHAKKARAICEQYELAYWQFFAMIHLLWAGFDESTNRHNEIDLFAQMVEQIINRGTYVSMPLNYLLLAEMQGQAGQVEAGMISLQKGLTITEKTSERWWEAETYRLLGHFLLQGQNGHEAEVCLQRALTISQEQGAKALELRAATTLARLWHQQTKTKQAYALLAPIYAWFTEGFDTLDLIEAKTLLDKLAVQG